MTIFNQAFSVQICVVCTIWLTKEGVSASVSSVQISLFYLYNYVSLSDTAINDCSPKSASSFRITAV